MLVINLWGGPGAGKTTTTSGLFHLLRHQSSWNVELITEFATDLCFEQARENLKDQMYLLGNQYHRLWRAQATGVECVITDAPIAMNKIYGRIYGQAYMTEMDRLCDALEREHSNVHVLVHRDLHAQGGYKGGSKKKDNRFITMFDKHMLEHGPLFDKKVQYSPTASAELAAWVRELYPGRPDE